MTHNFRHVGRRYMVGAIALSAGIGVALLGPVRSAMAQSDDMIRVTVNGDRVHFGEVAPIERDGRILVPLRGVLERLGAIVSWRPESQTVVASNAKVDIQLRLGDRSAVVNGNSVPLDVPAMTMDGRTMVPLRFLSEALGGRVHWDSDQKTVAIWTGERRIPDNGAPDRHLHRREDNPAK